MKSSCISSSRLEELRVEMIAPLSPGQDRMLGQEGILEKVKTDVEGCASSQFCAAPLDVVAFQVDGVFNEENLKTAFSRVVSKHPSLRTVLLPCPDGEVRQFVLEDNESFSVKQVNGKNSIRKVLSDAFDIRRTRIWPLERSLFGLNTYLLSESRYVLLFWVHHLISDRASVALILDEFKKVMLTQNVGLPRGRSSGFEYAQHSIRMRDRRTRGYFEPSIDYWLRALAKETRVLQFPETSVPIDKSSVLETLVDVPKINLSDLADENWRSELTKSSLSPFLFSLSLALFLMTGEEQLDIGCMTSGRTHQSLERLIGLIANPVIIRIAMNEEVRVQELIASINQRIIEAVDHQDVPRQDVTSALRRNGRLPIGVASCSVMVSMNNDAIDEFSLPSSKVKPLLLIDSMNDGFLRDGPTSMKMTWTLNENEDAYSGTLAYASDSLCKDRVSDIIKLMHGTAEILPRFEGTIRDLIETDKIRDIAMQLEALKKNRN